MDVETIFRAIKEIGLPAVVIILLLLFQFRTIVRLEKENERLLDLLLKFAKGGDKLNGDKNHN